MLESTISPFEKSKNQSIPLRCLLRRFHRRGHAFSSSISMKVKWRNWRIERSLHGFNLRMDIWFFQIPSDFIRNKR